MSTPRERLAPTVFDLDVQKIRRGYYSAVYFWRTKQILENLGYNKKVLMQVFQKENAVLCGVDEALAVIKLCSGAYRMPDQAYARFDRYKELEQTARQYRSEGDYASLERTLKESLKIEIELDRLWDRKTDELTLCALRDGDRIASWETVMTIQGIPQYFAHLESVYLGILARRTLVATNVARVVKLAGNKPVLFFADRFDHYTNQTGDGYAACVGGAYGVASDMMGEWWGKKGMGTIPHALIACLDGDTAAATVAFARQYPQVPCVSLVDFHNDCVRTSLEVADKFRDKGLNLWGVRLDTSETMVDESIIRRGQMGAMRPTGVNPMLVGNVREVLDRNGHDHVKIIVSGGFNADKIEYFEKNKVPVDAYGCGSSLLKGSNDFTADIVMVNGEPCGKKGRIYRPNDRLETIGHGGVGREVLA